MIQRALSAIDSANAGLLVVSLYVGYDEVRDSCVGQGNSVPVPGQDQCAATFPRLPLGFVGFWSEYHPDLSNLFDKRMMHN